MFRETRNLVPELIFYVIRDAISVVCGPKFWTAFGRRNILSSVFVTKIEIVVIVEVDSLRVWKK